MRPMTEVKHSAGTLVEVAPGERAVILAVGNEKGPVKRRLVDMGLTPGTLVTVRKIAPFGDPIEVNLRAMSSHCARRTRARSRCVLLPRPRAWAGAGTREWSSTSRMRPLCAA